MFFHTHFFGCPCLFDYHSWITNMIFAFFTFLCRSFFFGFFFEALFWKHKQVTNFGHFFFDNNVTSTFHFNRIYDCTGHQSQWYILLNCAHCTTPFYPYPRFSAPNIAPSAPNTARCTPGLFGIQDSDSQILYFPEIIILAECLKPYWTRKFVVLNKSFKNYSYFCMQFSFFGIHFLKAFCSF